MVKVSATQCHRHSSAILKKAKNQPMLIEKRGKRVAVLLSYEAFKKLKSILLEK